MTIFDVFGLGMATVDILTSVPRLPQSNEAFPANQIEIQGGGPVATALVTLSRLGARCAFSGTVVKDLWGEIILEEFQKDEIDTEYCQKLERGQSPISVILVESEQGNRSILYQKGGLKDLEPEQVPYRFIEQSRILHLDGTHLRAAIEAARQAKAKGTKVSFDGGAGDRWKNVEELVPLVDILIVAKQFAEQISGRKDPERASLDLLGYGAELVVITDGENGCWYRDSEQFFHQTAYQIQARDTTGAGDVFHGAYLFAYLQDWTPMACCQFASATAALKCTQIGGRKGIPELSEVFDFLKWKGERIE